MIEFCCAKHSFSHPKTKRKKTKKKETFKCLLYHILTVEWCKIHISGELTELGSLVSISLLKKNSEDGTNRAKHIKTCFFFSKHFSPTHLIRMILQPPRCFFLAWDIIHFWSFATKRFWFQSKHRKTLHFWHLYLDTPFGQRLYRSEEASVPHCRSAHLVVVWGFWPFLCRGGELNDGQPTSG